MNTDSVVVKRWCGDGEDRLLMQTPSGDRIGYWDLRAGAAYPTSPDDEAGRLIEHTAAGWVDAYRRERRHALAWFVTMVTLFTVFVLTAALGSFAVRLAETLSR